MSAVLVKNYMGNLLAPIGHFFTIALVDPILTILVGLYQMLLVLHVPYALGFAIILLTALIRLALFPLMASQMRTSKKMQELNPHLTKIKQQHKGDTMRIQQETSKLYKEHGINPAAGCLPLLIQLPIIYALYGALQSTVKLQGTAIVPYINKSIYVSAFKLHQPWDTHFFGFPLGQSPQHLLATFGIIVFFVPLLTAVLQFIQSKMMIPSQTSTKPVVQGEKKEEDFAQAFQTQSMYIFPLMIGFFSYSFPLGLSLYWNTFTLFGILQQYKISGWGGLASLMPKKKE